MKQQTRGNLFSRAHHAKPFLRGSPKLENYLRTYRKRASLSQDEMAYLLDTHEGTTASRYERFARTPSLQTALAYEAIFGVPVRELFAGVYQRAQSSALRRARLLSKRIGSDRVGRLHILGEVAPGEESKIAV